jgi:hypothetical protein
MPSCAIVRQLLPRTARLLTIPRRMLTKDELEMQRACALRHVNKSERIRKLQIYDGMAALFILGMLAEYLLTHL